MCLPISCVPVLCQDREMLRRLLDGRLQVTGPPATMPK